MTALSSASAQSIEASVSGFAVQSHVLFTSARAEQTGQWVSADGAMRLGKLRVAFNSALGSLNGDSDALHPDRTGRSTTLTLQMQVRPWLAVGPTAEAKRFDTDVGISVWRLLGANVRLTPSLIPASLEGLADVTFWPAATVIEGPTIPLALRTILGATYYIRRGPLGVRLAYRFERFDFETRSSNARLEQYRGATLGAIYRLGRKSSS